MKAQCVEYDHLTLEKKYDFNFDDVVDYFKYLSSTILVEKMKNLSKNEAEKIKIMLFNYWKNDGHTNLFSFYDVSSKKKIKSKFNVELLKEIKQKVEKIKFLENRNSCLKRYNEILEKSLSSMICRVEKIKKEKNENIGFYEKVLRDSLKENEINRINFVQKNKQNEERIRDLEEKLESREKEILNLKKTLNLKENYIFNLRDESKDRIREIEVLTKKNFDFKRKTSIIEYNLSIKETELSRRVDNLSKIVQNLIHKRTDLVEILQPIYEYLSTITLFLRNTKKKKIEIGPCRDCLRRKQFIQQLKKELYELQRIIEKLKGDIRNKVLVFSEKMKVYEEEKYEMNEKTKKMMEKSIEYEKRIKKLKERIKERVRECRIGKDFKYNCEKGDTFKGIEKNYKTRGTSFGIEWKNTVFNHDTDILKKKKKKNVVNIKCCKMM